MALDLEEQEQVAELKAWWTQHGNRVLAVVIAVAVAVVGWQGWRWYEHGQAAQASVLYDTLTKAAQAGDAKALRDAAGTLVESYPRTLYGSMGALLAAKFYFERNDLKNAKAQLQWVIEHSPAEDFRDLARLRLAAVLVDEKAYDEALKLLDAPHAPAYDAQYAALKGDVLAARNQLAEARAAYQAALEKAERRDSPFRESVRMRLEALGGLACFGGSSRLARRCLPRAARPAGRSRPRWSSFPIPGRCGCCGQRTWVARTASLFFRHRSATPSTRRRGMARWHASTWPTARSAGARPSKPGFPAASAPTCAPPRWPPRRAKSSPSTSRRERCAGGRASPPKCPRRRRWATGRFRGGAPTSASFPSARATGSGRGASTA